MVVPGRTGKILSQRPPKSLKNCFLRKIKMVKNCQVARFLEKKKSYPASVNINVTAAAGSNVKGGDMHGGSLHPL